MVELTKGTTAQVKPLSKTRKTVLFICLSILFAGSVTLLIFGLGEGDLHNIFLSLIGFVICYYYFSMVRKSESNKQPTS